ncbi:neural cell adhesion molecule 1-like [Pelobates cultripes]|uniref:Neural cell adhesion molecule 1-like n=1 Tax=Pelobates cultripes TaxID=61616 RepID=A0AAD1WQQ0_PELCU|nr:neural cell adhesion molecule 1-like [Pelobates cultripes]
MLSIDNMEPKAFSLLISALLIATVHSSRKMSVSIIPSNGEIYVGETKYFMCKATQEAELKWVTTEGDLEDEPGRFETEKVDETLIGVNVTLSSIEPDQVIKCQGETDSGESSEQEITLSVIQRPKIVGDFGSKKEFTAGSLVKIPCLAEGIPKPKVSWMRNGKAVSGSQDGSLQIDQIQLEDSGIYSCAASIDVRGEKDQKSVSITVNAAPVVRLPNKHLNATSKSNTSLTCSVTGNPAPHITWRRGEQPVLHDGEKYILSSNGQKLLIVDLDKSDEGEYTCNATNSLGMESASLVLEVTSEHEKGLGAGVIVGILLILFLVVMLAVDLTCFRTRRRGVFMYISTNLLGKSVPRVKLEETEVKKGSTDKNQVVNISGIDA